MMSINNLSEETLIDLQKRVRQAGIQPSGIAEMGFARAIFFEDPNGISLGFALYTRDLETEPAFYYTEPVPALQPDL